MADKDIELNPRFLVPPAVIDVRQENDADSYLVYENTGDVVQAIDGPILEYSNAPIPNAPSSYSIVSQTVRIAADGSTRVDVLLDFPDTNGVYNIDVRVTPA